MVTEAITKPRYRSTSSMSRGERSILQASSTDTRWRAGSTCGASVSWPGGLEFSVAGTRRRWEAGGGGKTPSNVRYYVLRNTPCMCMESLKKKRSVIRIYKLQRPNPCMQLPLYISSVFPRSSSYRARIDCMPSNRRETDVLEEYRSDAHADAYADALPPSLNDWTDELLICFFLLPVSQCAM